LQRLECEKRIEAEEKALETTAQISEGRRAKLAYDAFELSEMFVREAKAVHTKHPMAAAKLAKTAIEISAMIGGSATNYAAPPVALSIIQQWVGKDEHGNPTEPPPPVEELSLDQIESLAESLHAKPEPLPCSNWSETDKDASPVIEPENLPSPDYHEPEPNPDAIPGKPVPSRMNAIPLAGGILGRPK
jgi:hypothetical protein